MQICSFNQAFRYAVSISHADVQSVLINIKYNNDDTKYSLKSLYHPCSTENLIFVDMGGEKIDLESAVMCSSIIVN